MPKVHRKVASGQARTRRDIAQIEAQAIPISEVISDFSEEAIESFAAALPEPVCERRRKLLPQIVREWNRIDLRRYLPLEKPITRQKRVKKIQDVRKRARELLQALKALDQDDRNFIVDEILNAEGDVRRSGWGDLSKRLNEGRDFLSKLAELRDIQKARPGHPPNYPAYIVLQDAAAIFEWFTGIKASRVVDRDYGNETGQFFQFASALWPVVFGKDVQGLPAAIKNWAQWRRRHGAMSPLVANVDLRHPTWRVYEC